tara:strand:- start:161 stop:313 length:153 start_codon:yes stop_codon:yes gene_type:complete
MRVKATISAPKGAGYILKLHELEPKGFLKEFKTILRKLIIMIAKMIKLLL